MSLRGVVAVDPVAVVATTRALTPLIYPFTLGLIATVNPCGFPLLPVYLNFFVGADDSSRPVPERAVQGVVAGTLATAGFVALFGTIGLVVELGVSTLYDTASAWSRWLMVGLGVTMMVMGVLALVGKPLRLRLPELRPGQGLRRPVLLLVFGIAYGIASLGCALPLFLGGVAGAFTRSGVANGLSSFVAYALGMGFLFTVLAVVLAVTGPAAVRRLRVVSRIVPVVGGILLVVVGAYLSLYWLTAIVDPTATSAPVRAVESLQNRVADVLGAHAEGIGIMLGIVVVGTLLLYAVRGGPSLPHRGDRSSTAPTPLGASPTDPEGAATATTLVP